MDKASERLALVGTIDPDAYAAGTYLTDAIDMADFDRVLFLILAGDLVTNNTTDFKVTASVASGGTYYDLTGAAITQLTEAGSDSDKQAMVEVKAIDVLAAGYRYIKGSLTVATAGADASVVALGFDPHYGPASDQNLTSVAEIVTP